VVLVLRGRLVVARRFSAAARRFGAAAPTVFGGGFVFAAGHDGAEAAGGAGRVGLWREAVRDLEVGDRLRLFGALGCGGLVGWGLGGRSGCCGGLRGGAFVVGGGRLGRARRGVFTAVAHDHRDDAGDDDDRRDRDGDDGDGPAAL